MSVTAIIDYGAGNLHSVCAAFRRLSSEAAIEVTNDPERVKDASHIVLPGVGAFGDCIKALRDCNGMVDALQDSVIHKGTPFLGICVGMQMMMEHGHEHGIHEGLGWLQGDVVALSPEDTTLKIPHMGWNELQMSGTAHPALEGIHSGDHAYFVHSYHVQCNNAGNVLASVDYGGSVAAVIGRDNLIGTQFHPEKSQQCGAKLLENFLKM